MKKIYTVLAVILVASMLLVACGTPATQQPRLQQKPPLSSRPRQSLQLQSHPQQSNRPKSRNSRLVK